MIYSPTTEFTTVRIELDGKVAEADLIEVVPDAAHSGFGGAYHRDTNVSEREMFTRDIDFQTATTGELLDFVLRKMPQLSDHYAVAATLEMAGMRDVDAREWFGKENIFYLAKELFHDYRAGVNGSRVASDDPTALPPHAPEAFLDPYSIIPTPHTFWEAVKMAAPLYLRGLMSNAPWAMQIACLAIFGYAFGVSMQFSRSEATAAAIGMALSLIGTGGFVQTIGRLASFYLGQSNYMLTQQLYYRAVSTGLLFIIGVALAMYGASWFVPHFPPPVAATSAGYFVLFSSMSLCMSLFYVLHHYKGLIGSTFVGLVMMVLVAQFTTLGIQAAHWCGIVATNAVALVWLRLYLQRAQNQHKPQHQIPVLPRSTVLSYNVAPYFVAGVLYFGFLFVDRFVNWTTNAWLNGIALTAIRGLDKPVVMPLAIYPPYEIGLMWAFLAFTFTTPLLEYIITRFMQVLLPLQRRTVAFDRVAFNRTFVQMYARFTAAILVIGAIIGVWVYDGAVFLYRLGLAPALKPMFSHSFAPTEPVYFWAVSAYALVAIALMNNLILFSLSRPWLVVRSLSAGLVVNMLLGWTLSHGVAAWMSVIGLAAGALVVACVSGFYALRLLRKMDFYYYSAF
jgi:hypothetical protein